jgi:hypothetical protein
MACPCNNGSWPSPQVVWGPSGAGVLPPGAGAYQVRPFEPAFMTPGPVFAAMPYSPAVVAAVSPTFVGPATAVVPGVGGPGVPASATGVELVTPGVPVGPRCAGCCGRSYSPLPPNAVQAWGSVLGCGGTCATCQWRSL